MLVGSEFLGGHAQHVSGAAPVTADGCRSGRVGRSGVCCRNTCSECSLHHLMTWNGSRHSVAWGRLLSGDGQVGAAGVQCDRLDLRGAGRAEGGEERISLATLVLSICCANQPTTSSKSAECRAPGRAHGTCSVRTRPQLAQSKRNCDWPTTTRANRVGRANTGVLSVRPRTGFVDVLRPLVPPQCPAR